MPSISASTSLTRHLADLATNGYTVIENFLDAERLRRVRAGLARFLNSHLGRNNFEGHQTIGVEAI